MACRGDTRWSTRWRVCDIGGDSVAKPSERPRRQSPDRTGEAGRATKSCWTLSAGPLRMMRITSSRNRFWGWVQHCSGRTGEREAWGAPAEALRGKSVWARAADFSWRSRPGSPLSMQRVLASTLRTPFSRTMSTSLRRCACRAASVLLTQPQPNRASRSPTRSSRCVGRLAVRR